MTDNTKLKWTNRRCSDTYIADAEDGNGGYYEVVEYQDFEWGAKYGRRPKRGGPMMERFVPRLGEYARTAAEAKAFCEADWRLGNSPNHHSKERTMSPYALVPCL